MKLKSFTLAEMLVVMLVVAVVAMLTIPTVIKTNRDKAYSEKLEQTYQKIETALILDRILGFDVSSYEISSLDRSYSPKKFFALLIEELKTIKNCEDNGDGCFGQTALNGYSLRMINGAGVLVNGDYAGEVDSVDRHNKILGSTYIDVDGPIGPNKAGVDQFGFYTTLKGLIPMGGPQDNIVPFTTCLNEGGFACSAWVMVNKNMDYTKCPKVLNWENRIRCE